MSLSVTNEYKKPKQRKPNTDVSHSNVIMPFYAVHRTQRLEHVQKVLLEEIHSMEEEENTLTNMETDLAVGHTRSPTHNAPKEMRNV